jgi:hypothetical protein
MEVAMDDRRFDHLIRSLAEPRTRRTALQRLGSGLLAASVVAPIMDAEAKKGKGKKGKGKGKKKKCKGAETRCDTKCVDLQTTFKHCGKCDNECDPGQQCLLGECLDTCSPVCAAPEVCCVDDCVDLTSTTQHCGQCFKACAENEVCRFANCGCLGPRCPVTGSDATRCCPDANGTCCEGGGCCPNKGVCTTSGLCCDAGSYQCPALDVCCPVGLICHGFTCLVPERAGAVGAQRSVPAVKATRAL